MFYLKNISFEKKCQIHNKKALFLSVALNFLLILVLRPQTLQSQNKLLLIRPKIAVTESQSPSQIYKSHIISPEDQQNFSIFLFLSQKH